MFAAFVRLVRITCLTAILAGTFLLPEGGSARDIQPVLTVQDSLTPAPVTVALLPPAQ